MRKEQNIIPLEVIKIATSGDQVAMTYILEHFDNYLNRLARKTFFDGMGRRCTYVDQDIKQRLEIKLMLSVLKFDIGIETKH